MLRFVYIIFDMIVKKGNTLRQTKYYKSIIFIFSNLKILNISSNLENKGPNEIEELELSNMCFSWPRLHYG